MFSADERKGMLEVVFGDSIEIETFDGLLVDFARERNVDVIVKGLRAVSDFDYELQMAQMNHTMAGVETVFLPTNPEWSYLSSSLVREVARLGGHIRAWCPITWPPHSRSAWDDDYHDDHLPDDHPGSGIIDRRRSGIRRYGRGSRRARCDPTWPPPPVPGRRWASCRTWSTISSPISTRPRRCRCRRVSSSIASSSS
jgi:hypothetical protein